MPAFDTWKCFGFPLTIRRNTAYTIKTEKQNDGKCLVLWFRSRIPPKLPRTQRQGIWTVSGSQGSMLINGLIPLLMVQQPRMWLVGVACSEVGPWKCGLKDWSPSPPSPFTLCFWPPWCKQLSFPVPSCRAISVLEPADHALKLWVTVNSSSFKLWVSGNLSQQEDSD